MLSPVRNVKNETIIEDKSSSGSKSINEDIEPSFLTIESFIHDQDAVVFDTRVYWKIICLMCGGTSGNEVPLYNIKTIEIKIRHGVSEQHISWVEVPSTQQPLLSWYL